MTNSIGVNCGGPLHEAQAISYGIVGNAAVKLPDIALAQLHSRNVTRSLPEAWKQKSKGSTRKS
jgi:hypothetical protein